MTDDVKTKEKADEAGAVKKAGRGARRFATRSVFNRNRFALFRFGAKQLGDARKSAWSAMRPKRITAEEAKHGFYGRYPDGGYERFREIMKEQDVSSESLDAIEHNHTIMARALVFASLFVLVAGLVFMRISDHLPTIMGGAALGVCSLFILVMAIQRDFSAWQVRNRKIAGLREYMENRGKRPGQGVNTPASTKISRHEAKH